jgi:hypothetical protein
VNPAVASQVPAVAYPRIEDEPEHERLDDVSVVTGVSHSASMCERGESPGKPRKLHNVVKKPFAGVSVTASSPQNAATMTSTFPPVPPVFGRGQWTNFSSDLPLPPPPEANSEKSPEFVSVFSSGSNESQMSYPNDDMFVEPNQHRVGYPVALSAPCDQTLGTTKKVTRCYLSSEVHKLRISSERAQKILQTDILDVGKLVDTAHTNS